MTAQFDELPYLDPAEEKLSIGELNVLQEIAALTSSAGDITDVYSSVAALVAELIDWDGIIVNTPNPDGVNFDIRLREGDIPPGRGAGAKFEIEGSLFEEVQKVRQSVRISVAETNTAEWAMRMPGIRGSLLAGVKSFLSTPLMSQGELVGALYVQSVRTAAFNDHDRLLLERVVMLLGPAIARFDALRELEIEHNRAQCLLLIGKLFLDADNFDQVQDKFFEYMSKELPIDRSAIAVITDDGTALQDRYMYGLKVPVWDDQAAIKLDQLEPNGIDVISHGYILPPDGMANADPDTSPGLHANYKAGLRSAMFAGLRVRGQLLGTINVKSKVENAYTPEDLQFFEQVTNRLSELLARSLAVEAEEVSRKQTEKLRGSEHEVQRMLDVTQVKQRLLTSASHELRTPLTGILAFTDLLARNRSGNLEDKQLRYLSIVRKNAEELSGKINALISHADRDRELVQVNIESFDLLEMLTELVTDSSPKLVDTGHDLKVDCSAGLVIQADRRQLMVALSNLIENAAKYSPSNTTIYMAGNVDKHEARITVIDEGVGVEADHTETIFDPFDRGEKTGMSDEPGAGPGLSYVKAVAHAHNGDAYYEHAKDGGAKFTIVIPVDV